MRLTLRPKMMLAVLGRSAIVLALLAWAQYSAHQRVLLQTAEQTAFDLSSVIQGSLRQAMLRQDRLDTQVTIDNIAVDPQVINLMLLDRGATVRAAAPRALLGSHLRKTDGGCVPCHPGVGTGGAASRW